MCKLNTILITNPRTAPKMIITNSKKYSIKVLVLILALINYHNNIHNRTYLSQLAILNPSAAPWHNLLHNGNASSFLLMTGLTREAFNMLHDILKLPGHPSLPTRRACKWSLSSKGQLGLFLFYISSTMNYKYLCLIFGVTLNACSCMLRDMLKLAVQNL